MEAEALLTAERGARAIQDLRAFGRIATSLGKVVGRGDDCGAPQPIAECARMALEENLNTGGQPEKRKDRA